MLDGSLPSDDRPLEPATPLEVMLDNMAYWHTKAKKDAERLAILQHADPDLYYKVLAEESRARAQAQRCAVEAAPYHHRRLAQAGADGQPVIPTTVVNVLNANVA